MELTSAGKGKIQSIELAKTLSGSRQKVSIRLINKTETDIVLKNITTSCGCLVVSAGIEKTFAKNSAKLLPIELRVPENFTKDRRQLKIEDEDGSFWGIEFNVEVTSPFEIDKTPRLIPSAEADTRFGIPLLFVQDLPERIKDEIVNNLTVTPSGLIITKAMVEKGANGKLNLSITAARRGLQGSHKAADYVTLSSESFKLRFPVVFESEPIMKVSPSSIDRERLQAGSAKIIITNFPKGFSPKVKAYGADGVEIGISMSKVGESENALILQCKGIASQSEPIKFLELHDESRMSGNVRMEVIN